MVLTKEELISRIRERIGDSTTDEDIALLEDAADTLEDLDLRAGDEENWKEKYEVAEADWQAKYDELDRGWRQRYIDRFDGRVKDEDVIEDEEDAGEEVVVPITYEDLFEET